jgi:hypothetical protein
MRKERADNPLLSDIQKEAHRWSQIDACELEAQKMNFDTIPDKAILAYQQIYSEKLVGTDIYSPEFKKGREQLFIDASPVLKYGLSAGYVKRAFEKLRFACSTIETKVSFPLLDMESSPDGLSMDENKKFIELFQEFDEAWQEVTNWTPYDGARVFLQAIQHPFRPILMPNLRRDLSARTGILRDFKGVVGGAQIKVPTKVFGVMLKSDYYSGTDEFPKVEVAVVRLR